MFLFILSSPLHYYEGFFSFLYLLSIFFLFYVFCCEYSFHLKILRALQHNPTIINQTIDILFYPALLIVFLSRLAAWIHMLPRTPRTCHLFPGFLFSTCINQSIGNNGEKYLAPFWKWDKCMWIVWACLMCQRFLLWNILVSSEFFNWWGKRGNCIEMKLLHLQILSKLHFSNIKTAFSSG